jgi:DNA ligase-1
MKTKSFKPQLIANDEIDINQLSYPLLISTKMDGIRMVVKDGQILTRSLKQLPNKQLREKFEDIRVFTEVQNVLLDGEVFAPHIPFQFIVSTVMTEDCFTKQSIKKWEELCKEHNFYITREEVISKLQFYCFDSIQNENNEMPFSKRHDFVEECLVAFIKIACPVEQIPVDNAEEVIEYFEKIVNEGGEGLIIRNANSPYKYGRTRISENNSYKLKPWKTEDARIIGFVQATEVNEDAEKTTTELWMSRTSKRQEDRHNIEKASGFIVDFNGKELTVPISMTDAQKEYIWRHKDEYLGKFIEFKYMTVGMKDLPRIPKFMRMREDKE